MSLRMVIFSQVRLFGEALASHLEMSDDNITKVATCHLAERLVEIVIDFAPDIVLIDATSEQALAEARTVSDACPETPILALALPEIANEIIACADAGVVGYIPRQSSLEEFNNIVQMALQGECICHPKVTSSLLREIRQRRKYNEQSNLNDPLTHRECEILQLLGRGLCNKEIARELVLSLPTVKSHLHNIFVKLRVKGRAQALARLRNEPWLTRSA